MSHFAGSDQLPGWAQHVPAEWKKDWLKWHVALSTNRPSEEQRATLPYLSNEDIASWTGKLLREDLEPYEADSRLFRAGDVLFNKLRPYLAKVFHANFDGTSSGELLCLRPSDYVDARYLFYVLTSFGFVDAVDAQSFGSKMPRADWETVGHQPLPLPRIEVQQRIAHFLDEKTARIDALIEKKQALLERLAEKRQALIVRAVTKGLNPDAPMKPSGISFLGDVPAHWEIWKLSHAYTCIGSGTTPTAQSEEYYQAHDGIPWITTSELREKYIHETSRTVTSQALTDFPALRLYQPGSLFIAMYGATIGRLGINGVEAVCNQACCVFEKSSMLSNKFLFYWLLHRRRDLVALAVGGGQPNLSQEDLREELTMRPPDAEQSEITAFLDHQVSEINGQEDQVEKSISRLDEYRSALITAAVTGQLPELNG